MEITTIFVFVTPKWLNEDRVTTWTTRTRLMLLCVSNRGGNMTNATHARYSRMFTSITNVRGTCRGAHRLTPVVFFASNRVNMPPAHLTRTVVKNAVKSLAMNMLRSSK